MKKITLFTLIALLALGTIASVPVQTYAASTETNITLRATAAAKFEEFITAFRAYFESSSVVSVNASTNANMHKDSKNEKNKKDDNKKNSNILPHGIVKRLENGKGFPFGIAKNFFDTDKEHEHGNGTTTATSTNNVDITAPRINDIDVAESTTTATITWRSNEMTRGEINYSVTSPLTNVITSASTSLAFNQSVVLNGLTPNTVYYYTITAKDAAGNVKTSDLFSFRTNAIAQADTTAPNISFLGIANINATSGHLIYTTNEATTAKVWVGTTTPVSTTGTPTKTSTDLSFFHNIELNGLTASTTYFYTLQATDAAGNATTSNGSAFTTWGL